MTTKKCSKCSETKLNELFLKDRNVCRDCANALRRKHRKENPELYKKQYETKMNNHRDEINARRRDRYANDPVYIEKQLLARKRSNQIRKEMRLKKKEEEMKRIGLGNKECRYCWQIKSIDRFRHNRCKCRDCERDDPKEKMKRYVRTRIYNALIKNKSKNTIEYLGLSSNEYIDYIVQYNDQFSLENYGSQWHIDHVIPLSKFNLNDETQQKMAFNWRNTMPLSCRENLCKNNKIIHSQVFEHYQHLINYHHEKCISFPKEFIHLFATCLDAGNPLEPSTTTST
jgi:hypothetical protein